MYIKRVHSHDGDHYILRQTYRDRDLWKHRDLMDLGYDPAEFIEYPGGNGFYFDARVEETLEAKGVHYSSDELEEAFMPFLAYHIRRVIEAFRGNQTPQYLSTACSRTDMWEHVGDLHSFDKRRLHYLKFGRIDIGELGDRAWKFLNVLLCKSRDEIEATIESMERILKPHEIHSYVYAALDLQSYFPHSFIRNFPSALDVEKVDHAFLDALCRLNADPLYRRGLADGNGRGLHPYLVKYAIFYFDSGPEQNSPWEAYLKDYFHKHRFFPSQRPAVAAEEAYRIFGISAEQFARMSRIELTRLYRRKAKKMHPDKGGDHDTFVQLTEAYEFLLLKK